MIDTLPSIVRHYSRRIKNGRTLRNILDHMKGEVKELDAEVTAIEEGGPKGEDGVLGEAIDIIQCGLDMIFDQYPDITDEQINSIMIQKCQKWERLYANSIEKAPE